MADAVGPVYRDGRHGEPELLASCYRKCFDLAEEHGARSISFPAIGTGVYGYPLPEAAAIAVREVAGQLEVRNAPSRKPSSSCSIAGRTMRSRWLWRS